MNSKYKQAGHADEFELVSSRSIERTGTLNSAEFGRMISRWENDPECVMHKAVPAARIVLSCAECLKKNMNLDELRNATKSLSLQFPMWASGFTLLLDVSMALSPELCRVHEENLVPLYNESYVLGPTRYSWNARSQAEA